MSLSHVLNVDSLERRSHQKLYSREFTRLTICGFTRARGGAYLHGNSYHFLHPPQKNSPLVLLHTCWGRPTNVWTSDALAFAFMTLISYIYIYLYMTSHSSVTFTSTSEWLPPPSPFEQQLDSPTTEHLNADYLSQLGVGRLFRQSWKLRLSQPLASVRWLLVGSTVNAPSGQPGFFKRGKASMAFRRWRFPVNSSVLRTKESRASTNPHTFFPTKHVSRKQPGHVIHCAVPSIKSIALAPDWYAQVCYSRGPGSQSLSLLCLWGLMKFWVFLVGWGYFSSSDRGKLLGGGGELSPMASCARRVKWWSIHSGQDAAAPLFNPRSQAIRTAAIPSMVAHYFAGGSRWCCSLGSDYLRN